MAERPCTTMKGAVNCTPNQLARFISSLDAAGVSYPTSSSATGLCAPSRSTPTASGCSCNARPMDACPGSPSLATYGSSTAIPGTGMSMSSVPASPVSPGVSPESARENRMRATSGLTPTGLFVRYDPATCCWNKSQISLFTRTLEPYSGTWPAHGMMRSGQCWALTTWVLPIAGSASGYSWPTPNAQGGTGYMSGSNRDTWRPTLEGAVHMSPCGPPPAITADEYRGKGRKAAQRWPTPDASDWKQDGLKASQRRLDLYSTCSLNAAVRMWPTPTAHTQGDWQTYIQQHFSAETRKEWIAEGNPLPTGQGQLNPTWVEWLMDWPQEWTAPGPLSPQTYHAWLRDCHTALTAYVPWAMGGRPYARQ